MLWHERVRVDGRWFTVVVERDHDWYVGFCDEIPGCGSQGRSLVEMRFMVADAIHECLLTLDGWNPGVDPASLL